MLDEKLAIVSNCVMCRQRYPGHNMKITCTQRNSFLELDTRHSALRGRNATPLAGKRNKLHRGENHDRHLHVYTIRRNE